ncbi:hypothetical protein N752_01310 [Desulforamulus aquiferis]|nr:hypothetical protein [Desulforamulus aquiferis]RYD06957.1 hypothetical protein N752_01310 [Desulforamulus aquiferis]
MVIKQGKIVAKEGKLINEPKIGQYPDFLSSTIKLAPELSPDAFAIKAEGSVVK